MNVHDGHTAGEGDSTILDSTVAPRTSVYREEEVLEVVANGSSAGSRPYVENEDGRKEPR